jgi:hypothetical protein
MDDFSLERTELTGSLLSLEFGTGGRIQQLWAADPTLPEDTEEFQFCSPPISMGEESSEDYLPGTILLGARTHPEDPWILSRNSEARPLDNDEMDGGLVGFEYEFGFIDELGAIGKFTEIPGIVPQIGWELRGGAPPIQPQNCVVGSALEPYQCALDPVNKFQELVLLKYIVLTAALRFDERLPHPQEGGRTGRLRRV